MSGSMAAGHPEIEYPGCEVTTGPLGQGISTAVGMAMASKQLAATYNKDDLKVVDNKIWCFTGNGCLQEGVGLECKQQRGQNKSHRYLPVLFSHLPRWFGS
jgi:dihydroxyacetone synthase